MDRSILYLLAFVLLGLFWNCVQVQADTTDSLLQVIRTTPSDTTRLSALIALSEQVYAEDPDTNMIICSAAVALADHALARSNMAAVERSTLLKYKATAINNLAVSHYIFGELDSALACFHEARAIHAANGYVPGVADALNNEGLILGILGRYAEQRDMLFRAKAVYEDAGDESATAKALNNIATYYKDQGEPNNALLCFDSCLQIYQALGDLKGLADTRLNIGQALSEQGLAVEALDQYFASQRMYEGLNDKRGLSVCSGNISSILRDQGLTEISLEYAHRSLDLKSMLGDSLGQAVGHMNIGGMLADQGEFDLALAAYSKSLALFERSGALADEARLHGFIGDARKSMGELDDALVHFRKAMSISTSIGAPRGISNAHYKLGHYFEQVGELDSALVNYRTGLAIDQRTKDRQSEAFSLFSIGRVKLLQNKPKEAEQWARRSLVLATELGFPRNIMRASEVLYQALEQQGRWKEALAMLKLHEQMVDSVDNKDAAKRILRLQLRYAFRNTRKADSLEYAISTTQLELERHSAVVKADRTALRNKLISAGAVLLLLGGGVTFRLDRRRRKVKYQRDAALLELKALRAQMNPHFIFNALSSINDFVADNERDLASSYLTKFAMLMRLVLENSREPEVILAKDLEAIRLYMELEQLRLAGKFEYAIKLGPAVDPHQLLVPPMALQPFVENAIWHGIAPKAGKGRIDVTIQKKGERLIATITDDGIGCSTEPSPEDCEDNHSLGTEITRERLALMGEHHGVQSGFRYIKADVGTRVEVDLPWVQQEG